MDIKITMMNGGSLMVRVPSEATVMFLKKLILDKFQVSQEKQKLCYDNGQKIYLNDDSRTLSSYGVISGSIILVLITEPPTIQVFLKNEKGHTNTYEITPVETVDSFKVMVRNKEGVPVDQQRLIHEGKQMEDGKTLKYYNVHAESTIFLTLRLRGGATY